MKRNSHEKKRNSSLMRHKKAYFLMRCKRDSSLMRCGGKWFVIHNFKSFGVKEKYFIYF